MKSTVEFIGIVFNPIHDDDWFTIEIDKAIDDVTELLNCFEFGLKIVNQLYDNLDSRLFRKLRK
jgi:hypothetical protein